MGLTQEQVAELEKAIQRGELYGRSPWGEQEYTEGDGSVCNSIRASGESGNPNGEHSHEIIKDIWKPGIREYILAFHPGVTANLLAERQELTQDRDEARRDVERLRESLAEEAMQKQEALTKLEESRQRYGELAQQNRQEGIDAQERWFKAEQEAERLRGIILTADNDLMNDKAEQAARVLAGEVERTQAPTPANGDTPVPHA